MDEQIYIYPEYSSLVSAVAMQIAVVINDAITARGKCVIALSGGETPKGAYSNLGSAPFNMEIDWSRVHLFFGDERMVPPDDVQSNFAMVKKELLSKITIPAKNVHRIWTELDPVQAATAYEEELQIEMGFEILKFDLILLGIGEEGHTASLFPGTLALSEEEKYVSANFIPKLNTWRVTLTLPTINNAREIFFLASGKPKAKIVEKVINSEHPEIGFPATLIKPAEGIVKWMLDVDAASNLDMMRQPERYTIVK